MAQWVVLGGERVGEGKEGDRKYQTNSSVIWGGATGEYKANEFGVLVVALADVLRSLCRR